MPQSYFDRDTVDTLTALRERALSDRREQLLEELPTALLAAKATNTWRSAATCVYRNWLLYMCATKARGLRAGSGRKEPKPVRAAPTI